MSSYLLFIRYISTMTLEESIDPSRYKPKGRPVGQFAYNALVLLCYLQKAQKDEEGWMRMTQKELSSETAGYIAGSGWWHPVTVRQIARWLSYLEKEEKIERAASRWRLPGGRFCTAQKIRVLYTTPLNLF